MTNWQPIETAPKDGSAVWVAESYSGHGTGSMEPARTRRHFYGEWQNIYTGNSLTWHPTHWLPLPTPPGASKLIPDSDAVCTSCRWKGGHAPDCARADEPWPMIEVPA